MSVSYFFMLAGVILSPKENIEWTLKRILPGISLIGVFLVFLIPVAYTKNLSDALHDLNIKLPILLLGLIFLLKKETINHLKRKEYYLPLFVVATTLSVAFSVLYYLYLKEHGIIDSRKASPWISHIRLSLMAVLSGFYYLNKVSFRSNKGIAFLFASLLIFFAVFYLGWVNGILAAFVGAIVYFFGKLFPLTKRKLLASGIVFMLLVSLVYIETQRLSSLFTKGEIPKDLKEKTLHNRSYAHDTILKFSENGHLYGLYFQPEECKKEWENRSQIKFEKKDAGGNEIQFTCYRYLTSKGLPKDSAGVWQLTDADIKNIEKGIPNYKLPNLFPVEKRFYEFFVEWQTFKTPLSSGGHSLGMRTIYWATGLEIIKNNFWIGVGTGNIQDAINTYYNQHPEILEEQYRKHSHNQYITTFINSGLFGFLFFIFFLLISVKSQPKKSVYFITSLVIHFLSMLSEDTLETQAGVGLFIWIMIQGCFIPTEIIFDDKD